MNQLGLLLVPTFENTCYLVPSLTHPSLTMKSLFYAKDASEYPAPQNVYNTRIYFLAISGAMAAAMLGYDSAFVGGTLELPSFKRTFGFAGKEGNELASLKAHITSTFQAGGFFGALGAYWVNETIGRRWSLIGGGILFNIGTIIQVVAQGHLPPMYVGRVLTGTVPHLRFLEFILNKILGLAVGISVCVAPIYVSEASPPAIRGRLVGIFEIALQTFSILGYWMSYGVNQHISPDSDAQWQLPFAFQLVPGTLLATLMFFQPESPRLMIREDKLAAAKKTLSHIRHLPEDHDYISWEVRTVQEQIAQENLLNAERTIWNKLSEAWGPTNRFRLILGIALQGLQNMTGNNAIGYYSPAIFQAIGFSGTSTALLATGVYGIIKGLSNFLYTIFVMDRFGRRRAIMFGSAGVAFAMFYLAGYTSLSNSFNSTTVVRDGGAIVAVMMIYVFAITYGSSWCGIPWVYTAEIYPTSIRAICFAHTTASQWVTQFMVVYSTPYMMGNIQYGTFLVFGVSTAIGGVLMWAFLPETKGLSLEEMDILFAQPGLAGGMRSKTDAIIADRIVDGVGRAVDAGEKAHTVAEHEESV